ncbi:MAG: histidine kinase [Pedobacter sp.]
MKNCALLLLFLFLGSWYCLSSVAQSTDRFGNKFNFQYNGLFYGGLKSTATVHIPDTAIYQAFQWLNTKPDFRSPNTPILLGVKLNPQTRSTSPLPLKSLSKSYSSYFIADGSAGVVIAMGINKNNIADYVYRVVESDSTEIVPWSKIPYLEQKYGAKQPYGFIGRFQAPGKLLLVEVRNIKNYTIRDGLIFDWRTSSKPALQQIAIFARRNGRLEYGNLRGSEFAKKFDPRTNIPSDLKFEQGDIEHLQLFFNDHFGLPYSIAVRRLASKLTIKDIGFLELEMIENSYIIRDNNFDYPGKYEIIVNRSDSYGPLAEKDALRIPFEVLPRPFQFKTPRIEVVIIISVVILIIGGLIFLRYHKRSKERLQKSAQEKQLASLKLKSIRSQLNPHFMFNALTSIQNLINKNNIEEANFYLSKFAGLTRQVLDSNNEELISLDEEVKLLNNYLQMEQLRFNFKYEILVDESLNQANIEIPAMLLQPFVENAVKHGISGLKEMGMLSVKMMVDSNDLLLIIADNGKGFSEKEGSNGYGLKLSEERITLLNQLYKEQPLSLHLKPGDSGTIVTIRLAKWIS